MSVRQKMIIRNTSLTLKKTDVEWTLSVEKQSPKISHIFQPKIDTCENSNA